MKYYVSTGNHDRIVTSPDPEEAALSVVQWIGENDPDFKVGRFVRISEVGFNDDGPGHDSDLWMSTEACLEQLDMD